jgi:hypothetical protein
MSSGEGHDGQAAMLLVIVGLVAVLAAAWLVIDEEWAAALGATGVVFAAASGLIFLAMRADRREERRTTHVRYGDDAKPWTAEPDATTEIIRHPGAQP